MKNLLQCFNEKWVKGYCRHICFLCHYNDTCDLSCKYFISKYLKGFDAGIEYGLENEKEKLKNEYLKGYKDAEEKYEEEFKKIMNSISDAKAEYYDMGYADCKRHHNII